MRADTARAEYSDWQASASQIPVDKRHEIIDNLTHSDAILNRLVRNVNRINLPAGQILVKTRSPAGCVKRAISCRNERATSQETACRTGLFGFMNWGICAALHIFGSWLG